MSTHARPPTEIDWTAWRDYLARSRGPGRHGWNAWQSYLTVHAGKLRLYAPDFLVGDDLRYDATDRAVLWRGILHFGLGLELHVDKDQEVLLGEPGGPHVRTATYSYQVLRRTSEGEAPLWRYDNTHAHPGHLDEHHLHMFRDDQTQEVVHIGEPGWPTLGDVLEDLHAWWEMRIRSADE